MRRICKVGVCGAPYGEGELLPAAGLVSLILGWVDSSPTVEKAPWGTVGGGWAWEGPTGPAARGGGWAVVKIGERSQKVQTSSYKMN